MKKKILVLALALAMAVPALADAKKKKAVNTNNNNNSVFTVASVSPAEMNNDADTDITISGEGFSGIAVIGVKLGAWEGDAKDDTDNSILLSNITFSNDTTILATIPAGTRAQDNQDLTVFDDGADPKTHYTLADAISIHPMFTVNDEDGDSDGIVEVFQSSSKSSKAVFGLTVMGKSFKNKRWLKLKVGNKKAVITRISRSGENTIVRAKFKYGKMAANDYNINLAYKERLKYGVANSKNRLKYRNKWERGTITMDNAFRINSLP